MDRIFILCDSLGHILSHDSGVTSDVTFDGHSL